MSVEKNVLKPIVFSIPTVASTNTNVDIVFSEELLCAWRLQAWVLRQRFISGGGENTVSLVVFCGGFPVPLSPSHFLLVECLSSHSCAVLELQWAPI